MSFSLQKKASHNQVEKTKSDGSVTLDFENSANFSQDFVKSPYTIGKFSLLGTKHSSNEDRATFETFFVNNSNFSYAGVFDGHGGSNCAQHVSDVLGSHVKELFSSEESWESRDEVMQELFKTIDKNFCEIAIPKDDYSGCCATVVVCKENEVVIGNIGDCRAIVVPVNQSGNYDPCVEITVDHRADCCSEEVRILEAGGKVQDGRILSLQPSRSFGDVDVKLAAGKDVVIANPDVDTLHIFKPVKKTTLFTLRKNKKTEPLRPFMVIASDGVWDEVDTKQVAECVKKTLKSKRRSGSRYDRRNISEVCAEKVVKLAKRRGSDDDITVVVILF